MNKEQRKDDFNADFSKKTEAYRQQLLSRTNLTPQKLEKMLDDLIWTDWARDYIETWNKKPPPPEKKTGRKPEAKKAILRFLTLKWNEKRRGDGNGIATCRMIRRYFDEKEIETSKGELKGEELAKFSNTSKRRIGEIETLFRNENLPITIKHITDEEFLKENFEDTDYKKEDPKGGFELLIGQEALDYLQEGAPKKKAAAGNFNEAIRLLTKQQLETQLIRMFGHFEKPLQDMYNAFTNRIRLELDPRGPSQLRDADEENLYESARHFPVVALLGESGAGKTTLAHKMLHDHQGDQPPPIYVSIASYKSELNITEAQDEYDLLHGFLVLLERELSKGEFAANAIKKELKKGSYFLILDGLNEIQPEAERSDAIKRIEEFYHSIWDKRKDVNLSILVCCRETYWRSVGIPKVRIRPLNEAQIESAYYDFLPFILDNEQLSEVLKKKEMVEDLARTPMLFVRVASLLSDERTSPRTQGELFDKLVSKEFDRVGIDDTVEKGLWLECLGLVAELMREINEPSVSIREFREVIKMIFEQNVDYRKVMDTELLLLHPQSIVTFVHDDIWDFFIAKRLINPLRTNHRWKDLLAGYMSDRDWERRITFFLGLNPFPGKGKRIHDFSSVLSSIIDDKPVLAAILYAEFVGSYSYRENLNLPGKRNLNQHIAQKYVETIPRLYEKDKKIDEFLHTVDPEQETIGTPSRDIVQVMEKLAVADRKTIDFSISIVSEVLSSLLAEDTRLFCRLLTDTYTDLFHGGKWSILKSILKTAEKTVAGKRGLHESAKQKLFAQILSNRGMLAKEMDEFESALDYCKISTMLFKDMGDKRSEAFALNNFGSVCYDYLQYAHQGDDEEVEEARDDFLNYEAEDGGRTNEGKEIVREDEGLRRRERIKKLNLKWKSEEIYEILDFKRGYDRERSYETFRESCEILEALRQGILQRDVINQAELRELDIAIAKIYINIGIYSDDVGDYGASGQPNTALAKLDVAEGYLRQHLDRGDREAEILYAYILNSRGVTRFDSDADLEEIENCYNQAADIFNRNSHHQGLTYVYNDLAILEMYKPSPDWDKARDFLNKATGRVAFTGELWARICISNNMGILAYKRSDDRAAEDKFKEAARLAAGDDELYEGMLALEEDDWGDFYDQESVAIANANIGLIAFERKERKNAESRLEFSRSLFGKSRYKWALAITTKWLAKVYGETDDGKAKKLAEESDRLFSEMKTKPFNLPIPSLMPLLAEIDIEFDCDIA